MTGDRWCKSHEEYLSVRYFSSLDGLRAISILLVIWHHAVGGEGILGRGHHGVGLFFAISGFLITTLLVREHSEHGSINIRAFYLRRALRIFPLYYAVLAIYTLGWFLGTRGTPIGDGFLENLPAFATYTTNWFVQLEPGKPVAFYHAWSLATEEQFYLLWPPVLIALLPYARGLRAAGLVVATLAATDVAVTRLTDGDSFLRTVITSVATPICAGALVALAMHSRVWFRRLAPILCRPMASLFAFGLVALCLATAADPTVLAVSFAFLVACCTARELHWSSRLMTARAVAHVGRVSYGMYLIHPLVIGIVAVPLANEVHPFLTTVAVTLAISSLSYRYFESPLLRWRPSRHASAVQSASLAARG